MKRRVIQRRVVVVLLLLLVGGAIVNVGVASGCRYDARTQWNAMLGSRIFLDSRLFLEFASFGWPFVTVKGVEGFSPLWPGFAINTIFYAAILWVGAACC